MKGRAEHFLQSHWSHWSLSGGRGEGGWERGENAEQSGSNFFFFLLEEMTGLVWQTAGPPHPGSTITNQAELSDPLDISVAQRANKEGGPLLLPAAAVEEAWLCGSLPRPPPLHPSLSELSAVGVRPSCLVC